MFWTLNNHYGHLQMNFFFGVDYLLLHLWRIIETKYLLFDKILNHFKLAIKKSIFSSWCHELKTNEDKVQPKAHNVKFKKNHTSFICLN
jgi:hypothetical protein